MALYYFCYQRCKREPCWKEEFKTSRLGFKHTEPSDFLTCQWSIPPAFYVMYRVATAIYFASWIIINSAYNKWPDAQKIKWLIYLSNWTFIVLGLYTISSAFGTIFGHMFCKEDLKTEQNEDTEASVVASLDTPALDSPTSDTPTSDTPASDTTTFGTPASDTPTSYTSVSDSQPDDQCLSWYLAWPWICFTVAANESIVISAIFWIFLYEGEPVDGSLINTCVISMAFVIIDLMMTRMPIRAAHMWLPMLFSSIYVIFTLIYWALNGDNHLGQPYIFKKLDYSKTPGIAALYICLTILIAHPTIQLLLYFIYTRRLWLVRKINSLPARQTTNDEELTDRECREQNRNARF